MVRLLHTSDWHLGRLLYGKSLLEDQAQALEQIIGLIDRIKPHALLLSGDIFDRLSPPEAAVRLFDEFLFKTIIERKLAVLVIPGNHDSAERVGFASRILRERGLTIYSKPEDALKPVRIAGDGSEVMAYGIPYLEPRLIGEFLKKPLSTPDEAVRSLCDEIRLTRKPSENSVLLAHAFVVGAQTSESERDLFVGGSSHVAADAFEGFAYTALGHLHRAQAAGGERVRYSGSLLHYSKSEIGLEKSITEVVIEKDGSVKTQLHEIKPLKALRYLEGPIEELITKSASDSGRDDYIIAGLNDSGPVIDAVSRLRAVYPNLLNVSRVGGYLPEELPALERRLEKQRASELDLFSEFVLDTTGEPMNSGELDAITEVIRELEAEI